MGAALWTSPDDIPAQDMRVIAKQTNAGHIADDEDLCAMVSILGIVKRPVK